MGLLSAGTPLTWPESAPHRDYIRKHGILQFINVWRRLKDLTGHSFMWGDEVEYVMLHCDKNGGVRLSLRAFDVMQEANDVARQHGDDPDNVEGVFLPEYGRFMIEATPGVPYGHLTNDLRLVEPNMRLRRFLIESLLQPEERIMSLGNFPLMGVGHFTEPPHDVAENDETQVSTSKFLPDSVINPHPRFACLTRNIRLRRTEKVDIRVPLFVDVNTDVSECTRANPSESVSGGPEIHMDAMGFGMGCCCLQQTFQCRSLDEARHLYDQLAVLSPIMLALTASTPFYRGMVSDQDVRWRTIAQAVDDRTPRERGLTESHSDGRPYAIPKSRYESVSFFISAREEMCPSYNDLSPAPPVDREAFETLRANGVDELLATHVAHLFIRDPLAVYAELIENVDDEKDTNHFENIQSTNWQTVRFKPPPPETDIGWRVEFRPMEVQLTEFENAAFVVFVALLSRAILFFDLNMYIPMSRVDENMERAHERDAVRARRFFFRRMLKRCAPCGDDAPSKCPHEGVHEMSIDEIVNGDGSRCCPGLIGIVRAYLRVIDCDNETLEVVNRYLDLIGKRASGQLSTTSAWMRQFVQSHEEYQKDSKLSERIVRDLVDACDGVVRGTRKEESLLGDYVYRQVPTISRSDSSVSLSQRGRSPHLTEPTPQRRMRGASVSRADMQHLSARERCGRLASLLFDQTGASLSVSVSRESKDEVIDEALAGVAQELSQATQGVQSPWLSPKASPSSETSLPDPFSLD